MLRVPAAFGLAALLAPPFTSGAPILDAGHLLQKKLVVAQPSKVTHSSQQIAQKDQQGCCNCETVEFEWYASAFNIATWQANMQGANMEILSEGKAYTFILHPGSNIVRIPGILPNKKMGFTAKIGRWIRLKLKMDVNGYHNFSIESRDIYNQVQFWSESFHIPDWFKGDASKIRFYARDQTGLSKPMFYGDVFWYRSIYNRGWYGSYMTSRYECNKGLITRTEFEPPRSTFMKCTGWGDPHIKGWGYQPKIDFMGIGSFTQVKSLARSVTVHTYQCPFAGGTSINVGLAVKSGPHTITFMRGLTRINGSIYPDGVYALSYGTNVEINDESVEILGPTTLTGYASIVARSWIRPDSPTGYMLRASVAMPSASSQYATGECEYPPNLTSVPYNESHFSVEELTELNSICQAPTGWAQLQSVNTTEICGKCPPPSWTNRPLHTVGEELCKAMNYSSSGDIEACLLDYCATCGDSTVALMTADANGVQNNVTSTPSNLDEIVEEDTVSPYIAMAYCMYWGGGHVSTFDNNVVNSDASSDDGFVVDLVDSFSDDLQVQVLNCPISEKSVGAAPVSVAVRVGAHTIIARGVNVSVNDVGYGLGEHLLSGSVKMRIRHGLVEIRGAPRIMGIPEVTIRSFGYGDRCDCAPFFHSAVSVSVRIPATSTQYTNGLCKARPFGNNTWRMSPEDWLWPDDFKNPNDDHSHGHQETKTVVAPLEMVHVEKVELSGSLFSKHDACKIDATGIQDVASHFQTKTDAVNTTMVCNFCNVNGWNPVTFQDAELACASVAGSPFYSNCLSDYCRTCGDANISLVSASVDVYTRWLEDGKGVGVWPSGICKDIVPPDDGDKKTNGSITGDPHVRNIKGEAFDIHQTGWVQVVRIPREAEPSGAELLIMADLMAMQNRRCAPTFVHMVKINGSMLDGTPLELTLGPGSTPQVTSNRTGFAQKSRGARRELSKGNIRIATFNQSAYPASKGMMHVAVGQYNLVVKQRQEKGFAYFDLNLQGILEESGKEIGGLLGLDSHEAEARVPAECQASAAGTLLTRREGLGGRAALEEEADLVFDAKSISQFNLF